MDVCVCRMNYDQHSTVVEGNTCMWVLTSLYLLWTTQEGVWGFALGVGALEIGDLTE